MKKLLITALVASMAATAAHAAPKVYGQLDVSIDSINADANAKNVIKVQSNASRFGLKGEDELTPALSAIYQAEWEVNVDGKDGDKESNAKDGVDLKARDRFVGLKHNDLGAVKIGHYDSYTKKAQGKVDLFNDNAGGMLDMGKTFAGENRLVNVIGYESPKFEQAANLQFNVQIQPGEEVGTKAVCDADKAKCDDNGIANAVSASVGVSDEMFAAALAVDSKIASTFNANSTKAKTDIIRLVGSVTPIQQLTLGDLIQTAEPSDTNVIDKEVSYLVSGAFKVTEEITAKAQYEMATTSFVAANSIDTKLSQIALGLDYNFSEKTKAYGYIARQTKEIANVSTDTDVIGVAMLHKF